MKKIENFTKEDCKPGYYYICYPDYTYEMTRKEVLESSLLNEEEIDEYSGIFANVDCEPDISYKEILDI